MKASRLSLLIGVVMMGGIGAFAVWLNDRDPLSSLPSPQHRLRAERSGSTLRGERRVEHVVLHNATVGDIGIFVSLPDPLPDKKLPIVIVLGGLGTGESNIRYLAEAGDNAIIGYDWPMPVRFYSGLAFVTQIGDTYGHLMTIPAQVSSAIGWLSAEPWADRQRISLLGFSLGALAAPAIQDVAQHDGENVGWTILAYGGAPFGELVADNPHVKPAWLRPVLAPVVDLLLEPLEPTRHLPHLTGQFLVLEGDNDSLIPETARARLWKAVPEPKTIRWFLGDHMGVGSDKLTLLTEIIGASETWLIEKGAVNPF